MTTYELLDGYCGEFGGRIEIPHYVADTVSSFSSRVLESLKAGKRLPEARFANLKVAARGQQSVLGAFSKKG